VHTRAVSSSAASLGCQKEEVPEPEAVAFCDPIVGNSILSRLHKIYVIGYIIAHHFSGVFNR